MMSVTIDVLDDMLGQQRLGPKISEYSSPLLGIGDVEYVDIATPMLGDAGEPDPDLFIVDGLHLSDKGYALWTAVLKPLLLARHPPTS